ncbi:hypothetical protein GWK47_005820 [Chionoecetes opilio]|uniref:Uncharacterized protein n=1 Tax=Chionoecetes opilio TaxID=41210 RepID=A0A8J4YFS6_CHIOP|nr:hypothetical protein GWK47_005820 [Chionoecetes opilio]
MAPPIVIFMLNKTYGRSPKTYLSLPGSRGLPGFCSSRCPSSPTISPSSTGPTVPSSASLASFVRDVSVRGDCLYPHRSLRRPLPSYRVPIRKVVLVMAVSGPARSVTLAVTAAHLGGSLLLAPPLPSSSRRTLARVGDSTCSCNPSRTPRLFHQAEINNDFWHALRSLGFCLSFINSCINPQNFHRPLLISGTFRGLQTLTSSVVAVGCVESVQRSFYPLRRLSVPLLQTLRPLETITLTTLLQERSCPKAF